MPDAPDTFSCLIFLKGLSLYLPDISSIYTTTPFPSSARITASKKLAAWPDTSGTKPALRQNR